MTNVLHITYDMRIGGTEMVIKNIIEGADQKQYRMSVFCIEETLGPWGEALAEKGIAIFSTQRKPGFDMKLVTHLRKLLSEQKVDIVHCHQYTPWVYGCLAALFTKTKVIFTEHGRFYPDSSSPKRKFVNPLLLKATDAITAISKSTADALSNFEYIPRNIVRVIYNGIFQISTDSKAVAEIKARLGITQNTRVLGTIARFDPIKNHRLMLEAFRHVLDTFPDTKLLIVGDGPEKENILHHIERLQLKEHVILPGYVSNPSNYLACMDIFLLSSLSEGTSMTLLEANSIGIPCVVTDAGGNPEIIRHNFNGFVTPNDKVEDFHRAITELLRNEELLKQFSENAKLNYEERFTNVAMVKEYQALYRELEHK